MNTIYERYDSAAGAYEAAGDHARPFTFDWGPTLKTIADSIAAARDPLTRGIWMVNYIAVPARRPAKDSTLIMRALTELTPRSPLWAIDPDALFTALMQAGPAWEERPDTYVIDAMENNPAGIVRLVALYQWIGMLSQTRTDSAEFLRLYRRLATEFANTGLAHNARTEYDPDRPVQIGRPVPEFALASVDDAATIYTPASLKGRYYLIDFWASWCGPCLGELEHLHAAYDRYHERGFQILSISLDRSPATVAEFRRGRWNMPWLHAFASGGFDNETARRFGVTGIPKPVLVGPDGTIVAIDNALRGQQLESTLERLFETAMSRRASEMADPR
jgi:thiol-disulfide isomerase/thioredoxin